MRHARFLALAGIATLLSAAPGATHDDDGASGVPVHFAEGTTHGFLQLSTPGGKRLASGDLLVTVRNGLVTSRMVFQFGDKSYFEETVTFTQNRTFDMRDYHLVHRGPSFPFDIDARLAHTGHYTVVSKEHDDDGDDDVDRYEGTFDLPADTYNGMVITVAKNLAPRGSRRVHIVGFTPKPMLIELAFIPSETVRVSHGARHETATHYVLDPKLGDVTAFFAKLLGKNPPNSHTWIVTDDVPAFLRFEGPLFTGPAWRIDLVTPQL